MGSMAEMATADSTRCRPSTRCSTPQRSSRPTLGMDRASVQGRHPVFVGGRRCSGASRDPASLPEMARQLSSLILRALAEEDLLGPVDRILIDRASRAHFLVGLVRRHVTEGADALNGIEVGCDLGAVEDLPDLRDEPG